MINYKAINILKGLTKDELVRFEKFLLSPFFNNNKKTGSKTAFTL